MTPVERIRRIALLFQLEARFAFQFSVFACVARIFDRHLSGTLEAGKLLAWVNSVKSGVAHGDANRIDRFAAATALLLGTNPRQNQQRDSLFVFSRTRALLFLVKKIFGRDENKISNKVHFFLVDFESDF
ncbi:MAG TPA: hypothetical protein VJ248_11680 [Candidatus Udaeobacter sp.]|nr:hypothetical protein [Candidatus Udaeobacter sp.]